MKHIIALFLIVIALTSCSSNRYLLNDMNDDKDFLSQKIKDFKNTEGISSKPLIVVDGKPYRYTHELKEEKLNLSKSDIKKLSVLKKETGIAIYGEYAEGGVIVISKFDSTNKKLDKEEEESLANLANNGNILYFVNGIEVAQEDLQKIDPDEVETVEVLKGEAARKLFPDKDLDGAIYIKTKSSFIDSNVLFLVDDKEISKEELKAINPNDIEIVTVIKEKEEIKKYTTKEYDGVVIIVMKKQ